MKSRILFAVAFVVLGFLAGTSFGYLFLHSALQQDYIAINDIDLESAYFFQENKKSPISGVLREGSAIKIGTIKKPGVTYVYIPTALKTSEIEASIEQK